MCAVGHSYKDRPFTMEATEWEKLRKNWDDLRKDIYPSEVLPRLYQEKVITLDEKNKISKAGTSSEQMECLLSIIKKKRGSFDKFIQALKVSHDYLAEKIVSTETTADPSLKNKEDPLSIEDAVHRFLDTNYTERDGAETSLKDVRFKLEQAEIFKPTLNWSNAELLDFICKHFSDIRKENRKVKGKKSIVYLSNFHCLSPEEKETRDQTELQGEESLPGSKKKDVAVTDVTKMGPSELKTFLSEKLSAKKIPVDVLNQLEKEDITGELFLTLSEEDLKELGATLGIRRILKGVQEDLQRTPTPLELSTFMETLRPLNQEVGIYKYTQGWSVDSYTSRRDKRVRNFPWHGHLCGDALLDFVGSHVVEFASACLNDRKDGTVYFGLAPRGGGKAEVMGLDISQELLRSRVDSFLNKGFCSEQLKMVQDMVRPIRFVPVHQQSAKTQPGLCVVEVDIVPLSAGLKDDIILTNTKCLPKRKKFKSDTVGMAFSEDGTPESFDSGKFFTSRLKDQPRVVKQREEEEERAKRESLSSESIDLSDKLLKLLTGGAPMLQDGVSLFLVTSPVDTEVMDRSFLLDNTDFVRHLQPEVVFDFDPQGEHSSIYSVMTSDLEEPLRRLTLDNFDTDKESEETVKDLTKDIWNESKISWIFCNGYDELGQEPMNPGDWQHNRKRSFFKVLETYTKKFGPNRVIVLFCLFSKTYESMIDACVEILLCQKQWILLAETETVASMWKRKMLDRDVVKSEELRTSCVVGMPWLQINATMVKSVKPLKTLGCFIPCSTGAIIQVREKKVKEWDDLDIASAEYPDFEDDEETEKVRTEMESVFYKGEQVDWMNFYFQNQVLRRNIHDSFVSKVKDALKGKLEEDCPVPLVHFLHQPGAGGTTSAKQVLWDLRKKYRSVCVRFISDQTLLHLEQLWRYEDKNPKPLLVFIDNQEDDELCKLKAALITLAREAARSGDSNLVFCTIINCSRQATLPQQVKGRELVLRQELTQRELNWFKKKHEDLTSLYQSNKDIHIDPKFLVSFNILRENFSEIYIETVVKDFLHDVTNDSEKQLLKMVAFLNCYDLNFNPIPVSCFDHLLNAQLTNPRYAGREQNWDASLSQSAKVLLNVSSIVRGGKRHERSVRIFHKKIATEILRKLKEMLDQRTSEVMLEILSLLGSPTKNTQDLQKIVKSVIRNRRLGDNHRQLKFSDFIIDVQKTEGPEVALDVMKEYLDVNKDAFTAQLIARFLYIELNNWEKAEEFAKEATTIMPHSSFLWDTRAQVHKSHMKYIIECEKTKSSSEFCHVLIKLAQKSLDCFQEVQKKNDVEYRNGGEINLAGYFGELRSILLLLNALKMSPNFKDDPNLLNNILRGSGRSGEHSLNEDEIDFLGLLFFRVQEAMRRLEDEYLQVKDSFSLVTTRLQFDDERQNMLNLKANLDSFFGESNRVMPKNLTPAEQCNYRYRRALLLGGTLNNLLDKIKSSSDEAKQIFDLMKENTSRNIEHDHLEMLLSATTVLLAHNQKPKGLGYDQILEWSKKLYDLHNRAKASLAREHLEAYLYFVLYNFPTENRRNFATQEITDVVEKWREAFKKNFPYVEQTTIHQKRETTLFFLGNGLPPEDIVYQDSLKDILKDPSGKKWHHHDLPDRLMLMTGTLDQGGRRIVYRYKTKAGNNLRLNVHTGTTIRNKNLWNSQVYFYLGFSFNGPKAYGVSDEPPSKTPPCQREKSTTVSSSHVRGKDEKILQGQMLFEEMSKLNKMLSMPNCSKHEKRKMEMRLRAIKDDLEQLYGE